MLLYMFHKVIGLDHIGQEILQKDHKENNDNNFNDNNVNRTKYS